MTTANAVALADQGICPPRHYREPYALSFDFDGTLADSKGRRWLADPAVDTRPVLQAFEHGYVAFVLTVNDTAKVAALLRKNGIDAVADGGSWTLPYWDGGETGTQVLVTNRKLKARAYIDDRGLNYRYGGDPADIWAELDKRHGPKRPSVWRRLGTALGRGIAAMGDPSIDPWARF